MFPFDSCSNALQHFFTCLPALCYALFSTILFLFEDIVKSDKIVFTSDCRCQKLEQNFLLIFTYNESTNKYKIKKLIKYHSV